MTTSIRSMSSYNSMKSAESQGETKKYLLLRDTVAKTKWPHGITSRSRLLSKRSEQRVLKGSLWQEVEDGVIGNSVAPSTSRSLSRSGSSITSPAGPPFKQVVESIEIEDLHLQCASGFLAEISDETCRLLLAIPTSEERFYVFSDTDRMKHAQFINVGADVIVNKRNIPPCRAAVRWKGRLAGKQGLWFGVEIMDEQSKGSGDSDGSVNNIRLFSCEKNNGMFVNIGQLTLVPPKRPMRRQKKRAPSTPSQGSENMTNGSQNSDPLYPNDLVSQTESELSFMDDVTSAETVPLVDLQVNDRVVWPSDEGYERAVVRWIGTLPEEESLQGEILVGVEFDNPIGKGTGVYKNRRLFDAKRGHASLVPLEGLVKISSSLRNMSETSSPHSLNTPSSHGGASPRLALSSADDVLESLAIESERSDLSDVNNNASRQLRKESPTPRARQLQRSSPVTPSDNSPDGRPSQTPPSNIGRYTRQTPPLLSGADNSDPPEFTNKPPPDEIHKPTMNGDVHLSASSNNSLTSASSSNNETHNAISAERDILTRLPSANELDTTDAGWESCDSPVSELRAKISPPKHRPKTQSIKSKYHKTHGHVRHSDSKQHSSRAKSKHKNGLIGLHTLAAKDMTGIIGDLSIESTHNGSINSMSDVSSRPSSAQQQVEAEVSPPPPLMNHNNTPLTSSNNVQSKKEKHRHEPSTQNHLSTQYHEGDERVCSDRDYIDEENTGADEGLTGGKLSSSRASLCESDDSMTSSETISEEGSYTIQRADTLSPLMESSLCSSVKGGSMSPSNTRGSSMTPPHTAHDNTLPRYNGDHSDIQENINTVTDNRHGSHPAFTEEERPATHSSSPDITQLPCPLRDVTLESHAHSIDISDVPDPPPEFMGDYNPDQPYTGLWKGAAGSMAHPSFVEAILYLMSISTDILCCDKLESPYRELKHFLLQKIVYPLKRGEFIDVGVMEQWRTSLNEISTGQLLQTDSARELHKFIKLLLQHVCNIPPLYNLNNHETGYTINLVSYRDARIGFPTVQKLLEKTCVQQQIKLNKVPNVLILVLPRWTLNKTRIFPNLHIDLTDVLEYARRICHMCGDQAVFECPECYEHESTELSAAAFCEPCSQTVHKHSKRSNHMPVQLKTVLDVSGGGEEGSILRLRAVLTVRDNHYTSLSEPPGAEATGTQWLLYNPKSAAKGTEAPDSSCYVPEVTGVPGVANWLSMDAYEDMAHNMESIPDNIERVLQDCCMCVYSKT